MVSAVIDFIPVGVVRVAAIRPNEGAFPGRVVEADPAVVSDPAFPAVPDAAVAVAIPGDFGAGTQCL